MRPIAAWVMASLVLTACAGSQPAPTAPTTNRTVDSVGVELFNERVVGSNPGCVTCHSLQPSVVLVGPSLAGMADRADVTVPGMTGRDYVREAIVDPDAHIVDGFAPGQMPGDWDVLLTAEQIESLVDLLLAR